MESVRQEGKALGADRGWGHILVPVAEVRR